MRADRLDPLTLAGNLSGVATLIRPVPAAHLRQHLDAPTLGVVQIVPHGLDARLKLGLVVHIARRGDEQDGIPSFLGNRIQVLMVAVRCSRCAQLNHLPIPRYRLAGPGRLQRVYCFVLFRIKDVGALTGGATMTYNRHKRSALTSS